MRRRIPYIEDPFVHFSALGFFLGSEEDRSSSGYCTINVLHSEKEFRAQKSERMDPQ